MKKLLLKLKKPLIGVLIFIVLIGALGFGLQFFGILDLRARISTRARVVPVLGDLIASHEIRQEQEERIEDMLAELNRLEDLNQQLDSQLVEYEEELLIALDEIDDLLAEIESLEEEMIAQDLSQEEQEERLEGIAEIYMTMDPVRVAEILAELDDQLSARLLSKLTAPMAGAVLTQLATENAAMYSRILSGEFEEIIDFNPDDLI